MSKLSGVIGGTVILAAGFVASQLVTLDISRTPAESPGRYIIMHNPYIPSEDYKQFIGLECEARDGYVVNDENMSIHQFMANHNDGTSTLEVPRKNTGILELLGFTVWNRYNIPYKPIPIKKLPKTIRCTLHAPF